MKANRIGQALLLIAAGSLAATANAAAPGLRLNLGEVPHAIRLAQPRLPVPAKIRSQSPISKPRQFAVAIPTDITPDTEGNWEMLQDGRWLWRVQVGSAGAKSLNLAFGHLRLPGQAELYVHDAAGMKTHGPYAAKDLRNSQLWTPIVEGDSAVVEVVVPAAQRNELELQISQVNYGFAKLSGPLMGESASCQIDVACSTGDAWSEEARSVAVYTFGGEFSCTGTLINNTARDQTPYFLTANHCIQTAEQAASTVFYWNYQASTCGGKDGNRDQSQSGADLVAHTEFSLFSDQYELGSDFSLMKLWQKPDPSFGVYYSGWDRRDRAPSSGVIGIHHPMGDAKKIVMSDLATDIVSLAEQTSEAPAPETLTYLRVPGWTLGTLEYGSSGSGLWNAEHRLVGHVMGTAATCEIPDRLSLYGRLYSDWSSSSDPRYSIATYLDPANSGLETLDGLDSIAPAPEITTNSQAGSFALTPALLLLLLANIRRKRQGFLVTAVKHALALAQQALRNIA